MCCATEFFCNKYSSFIGFSVGWHILEKNTQKKLLSVEKITKGKCYELSLSLSMCVCLNASPTEWNCNWIQCERISSTKFGQWSFWNKIFFLHSVFCWSCLITIIPLVTDNGFRMRRHVAMKEFFLLLIVRIWIVYLHKMTLNYAMKDWK